MKKLATILMLIAALLCSTTTIDAKTTKRASKAQTSQTSSNDMWNGDIPTGKNICSNKSWSELGYYKKGYRDVDGGMPTIKKNGVCEIECWGGSGGSGMFIRVYNTAKLNWLYQDLKKANAKYKTFTDISIYKDSKEIWVTDRD